MVPAELFAKVEAPNAEVEQQARDRQLTLTKPAGSLGRLEDLGVWISACQGQCPPHSIDNPRIVVFAGDHGVAQHGVSAYPSEVSLQMAANIQAGGAAINVLGRAAGASVRVVDVSLDHDVWGDERVSAAAVPSTVKTPWTTTRSSAHCRSDSASPTRKLTRAWTSSSLAT